jgi:antitoxin component YwqK of YwqJK toxin-antitoxin module
VQIEHTIKAITKNNRIIYLITLLGSIRDGPTISFDENGKIKNWKMFKEGILTECKILIKRKKR